MTDTLHNKRKCNDCRWYSGEDVSVCCCDKSEHLGDFVMHYDTCPQWERLKVKKERKSEPKKADFIRDDEDLQTILICAVRYALGRATYMPGLVTGWIEGNCIDKLSKKTIGVMIRDIDEARGRNGLGMACDVEVWLRFYEWLKKEEQKQWEKSASLLR